MEIGGDKQSKKPITSRDYILTNKNMWISEVLLRRKCIWKWLGCCSRDYDDTTAGDYNICNHGEEHCTNAPQCKALKKNSVEFIFFKASLKNIFRFSTSYNTNCLTHSIWDQSVQILSLFLLHHPTDHLSTHGREGSNGVISRGLDLKEKWVRYNKKKCLCFCPPPTAIV